jgi:hypothetical protein
MTKEIYNQPWYYPEIKELSPEGQNQIEEFIKEMEDKYPEENVSYKDDLGINTL